MDDLREVLTQSSKMMINRNFTEAEDLLDQRLREAQSKEDQALLLQQIMHVRIASGDLPGAQLAMDAREELDPSGYTALSNAYFQHYSKGEPRAARVCVSLAIERAKDELDPFTLYMAHSLSGLLAARALDWVTAEESLCALWNLLGGHGDEDLPWGDAVPFLEEIPQEPGAFNRLAVDFAALITPKIEDDAFHRRAELAARRLQEGTS